MKKLVLLTLVLVGGIAAADPKPASNAGAPVARECDPFSDMHCQPGSVVHHTPKPGEKRDTTVAKPGATYKACNPFATIHSCDDKVVAQNEAKEAPPPAGEPVPPPAAGKPNAAQLHQTCVDAMNADPDFAKSIVAISDKQIDQKTVEAHQDADFHIQKNERHVIYAYAAMWVVAALFVLFLWMRQVKLLGEIASLKRDLEAAAATAPAPGAK